MWAKRPNRQTFFSAIILTELVWAVICKTVLPVFDLRFEYDLRFVYEHTDNRQKFPAREMDWHS